MVNWWFSPRLTPQLSSIESCDLEREGGLGGYLPILRNLGTFAICRRCVCSEGPKTTPETTKPPQHVEFPEQSNEGGSIHDERGDRKE